MTNRAYYSDSIANFLIRPSDEILGILTRGSIAVEATQRDAWLMQIELLRPCLEDFAVQGHIYFEYVLPRLGRRIDTVLLIDHVVFILEFKVGESTYSASAVDQVWDYALDLKNFHETSHDVSIAPVLIATKAKRVQTSLITSKQSDGVLFPIRCSPDSLRQSIKDVLAFCGGATLDARMWEAGRYKPTPTIIEAATALYGGHSVSELSRSGAEGTNLSYTSETVSKLIHECRAKSKKVICFVTGVPGAGKTLVGLNIATQHIDKDSDLYSVYLSGNGPLVAILREALTRDKVSREAEAGRKITKGEARRPIEAFIQNVHHFRDECLRDEKAPPEHVAIFDEAQRAWNKDQTSSFMARKKGRAGFDQSEPEFLISCLNRHDDWAVVVCLVGGGQEINTGEAGIAEWLEAIERSYAHWDVYISPQLGKDDYAADAALERLGGNSRVIFDAGLHLSMSMRSFRAEKVSDFVKKVLDMECESAATLLQSFQHNYPIVLTRSTVRAKEWLREHARGSERFGMMVSSQAQRLKPYAIDVRSPVDPIHWFLNGKEDVRSSFYLEDVATEFHVQGLEVDWGCVVWDGDFRFSADGWRQFSFVGDRWQHIRKAERQMYLKNAYRVLLTRARQGMVVVVPEGSSTDPTRSSDYYDPTFQYLQSIGLPVI